MNLCVCGYYGLGNFGDELFLKTLQQAFPDDCVYPYSPFTDISRTDAVIIGGGDLITPYHFNKYYFPPLLKEKPTWVYGVGIVTYYPESTWPEKEIELHRQRLQPAKGLYLRDELSARIARKLMWNERIEVVPDMVFGYKEPRYPITKPANPPTIGVCIFSYEEFPMDKVAELLLTAVSQGYRLLLIPVVNQSNNPYVDYPTCEALKELVLAQRPQADVSLPGITYDLELTYSLIQSVDYLISFKLHPALVALRAGVPVFSLSKMSKVASLLRSFGLDHYLRSFEAPVEELKEVMLQFLQNGKQHMQAALPAIRATERASKDSLSQLRKEVHQLRT
jgi:polysaccharide pyruvyl transferase WcaK-like protein